MKKQFFDIYYTENNNDYVISFESLKDRNNYRKNLTKKNIKSKIYNYYANIIEGKQYPIVKI